MLRSVAGALSGGLFNVQIAGQGLVACPLARRAAGAAAQF
jgi:hypothetical protein